MRELVKAVSRQLEIDRNEAELVIATLLDRPRLELYMNEAISGRDEAVLWTRIEQLRKGMPVEYVTQRVQFRDYKLKVVPGVFIPRLETEYFIELIVRMLRAVPTRILEIGTGCAAISIALADKYRDAEIVATDISELALKTASGNVKQSALDSRIHLVQANVYDGIAGEFDLIVSNPPYVPSERMPQLPMSVREFEPLDAIDGGQQGIQFIKKLVSEGRTRLNGSGVMAFEIDEESTGLLKEFLEASGIGQFQFCRDLFGKYRYLFIGDIDEKS
jgi:release factor glutamine methyltransferase